MSKAILLRADGSPIFGMGHIFRSVAIAQGLVDKGHRPIFVLKDYTSLVLKIIHQQGFEFAVIENTADFFEVAKKYKSSTVIVDLNHAATLADEQGFERYLMTLKEAGLFIVMIDGLGVECISTRRALPVDVLFMPYVGALEEKCHVLAETVALLGPSYFPFQKDFLRMASEEKIIVNKARRILVSMGGGDVRPLNEKVVKAISLLDHKDLELKVTGSKELPHTNQMPELMHWADMAIIGSGLTKYEAALLGTPAIVLSMNKAQKNIMKIFEKAGTVIHLGCVDEITEEILAKSIIQLINDENLRKSMSMKGRSLLDGCGIQRLIQQIPLEVSL